MLIGYARASTQDQNFDFQTEALTKVDCKKIFNDKTSGSRAERPGLTKALEMLRQGDTLIVWKLDRLGCSVKNLADLVGELHRQGIQFKSLTDAIDTGTPAGRFFLHVIASLVEMERELAVEHTRVALGVARQLGRKGGRKRQMTDYGCELVVFFVSLVASIVKITDRFLTVDRRHIPLDIVLVRSLAVR